MALWKKQTREDMLAWFATLDDETLEIAWRSARDRHAPGTHDENFICRGCRHNVPGLSCEAPASMKVESYRDCEKAVTESTLAWLSRMKDPFVEEGREAYVEGSEKSDCPYGEGTDGEAGWKMGWSEADELDLSNFNIHWIDLKSGICCGNKRAEHATTDRTDVDCKKCIEIMSRK